MIRKNGSRQKYIPIGEFCGESSGEAWGEPQVRQMQEPCELTLSIGDVGGEFMKKKILIRHKIHQTKTLSQN